METKQKTRIGLVVSDKMDKTVVVAVEQLKRHPLYKKAVKRIVRIKAHDEKNESKQGYTVRIIETRPISKEKRWRVAEIIARGEVIQVKPEEIASSVIEKVIASKEPAATPDTGEKTADAGEQA